jgi:hypothetical protein
MACLAKGQTLEPYSDAKRVRLGPCRRRELQEMRFTWYEKDIDIAVRMAATVDRELVLSTFVQRLMRDIDVPKMAALLADRGTIELTGALEAARR